MLIKTLYQFLKHVILKPLQVFWKNLWQNHKEQKYQKRKRNQRRNNIVICNQMNDLNFLNNLLYNLKIILIPKCI